MMNWTSWQDFLAMGGYGFYVWNAFAAVAIALGIEVGGLRRRLSSASRQARARR